MEVLAMALLKTLATTCLKHYLAYLFAAGGIQADSKELGYSIPSWYMNPGRQASAFYAYGTSVNGDEFESIEDARRLAVDQMATLMRRSHQRIISEEIRFDQSSIKQRRLVDLFLRGEQLDAFIQSHAVLDKKQLIKVKNPQPDMRAFVRLALKTEDYIANQESTLHDLRVRLTQQKSEDIMQEMETEMQNLNTPLPDPASPSGPEAAVETPPAAAPADAATADTGATEVETAEAGTVEADSTVDESPAPAPPRKAPPAGASVFDAMQSELDGIK
jgi:uncharacterized coiled-coil protein SlyX